MDVCVGFRILDSRVGVDIGIGIEGRGEPMMSLSFSSRPVFLDYPNNLHLQTDRHQFSPALCTLLSRSFILNSQLLNAKH